MATSRHLALELAGTIRHDGNGGVADDLAEVGGLAEWLTAVRELLAAEGCAGAGPADADREQVLAVRAALRALLARAVSPAPPSRADADRLLPVDEAVARLNAAAAGCPVAPRLDWPQGGAPAVRLHPVGAGGGGLVAALARAAMAFLSGPDVARLRACTAPRCVRYFLKEHGRQEFCKASCSNRARAARHYQRHHGAPAEG
ncbi:CGNR zinc finger domain-containing protein [Streptomyces sp. NRRL WC-3742]|uniref:ABATE domain-containing protein n=1 Tax=Streptomyces sp. NRRL WC-3742 TaxID=1463934 RepID=UPI0004CBC753|nr:CGNR zinc finger domain-containing protein [Streptomyces sp. NRRL WC-3742]